MFQALTQLFRLPHFDDPAKDRAVTFLAILLPATFFISFVIGIIANLQIPGARVQWHINLTLWAGLAATWFLLIKGHVRVSAFAFLSICWLLISARIATHYGGLDSPFLGIFLLLILGAGFLLGSTGGFLYTALSLASLVWMLSLEAGASVPQVETAAHVGGGFLFQFFIVLLGGLIQAVIVHSLDTADQRALARRTELETANQQLQELQTGLELRVAEHTRQIELQKQHFQTLFEYNPLAIVSLDTHHHILDCNAAFERLFGYRREEIQGKALDPLVGGVDAMHEARANTEKVLRGEEVHGVGVRYRKDGTRLHLEIVGVPVRVYGNQEGVLAIYHDLSEQLRAEEAQRASEQRYRQAVEHSPNPIFIIDPGGDIQTWNPACVQTFRYGQEIVGRSYTHLIPTASVRHKLEPLVAKVLQGTTFNNINLTYTTRQGVARQMVSRIYPLIGEDGVVTGCVFANTDVTDRHRMEDALRNSELKFRNLVEQSQDGITIFNEDGRITVWNPAMVRLTGIEEALALGRLAWELQYEIVAPAPGVEDLEFLTREYQEFLQRGEARWSHNLVEHILRRPDGSLVNAQSVAFPIRSELGTMGAIFTRDITERVQSEERLKDFYRTFATVLDGLEVGVYVADMENGEVLMANRRMEETFGPGVAGKRCYEVFRDRNSMCPECNNACLIDNEDQPTNGMVWENRNLRNGRWYIFSARAIRWSDGRQVRLEAMVDITDRKETEEHFKHLATHDTLTGLPNRSLFEDRLQHALAVARRNNYQTAVLFMDLDGFKNVNDRYGHAAGDAVLVEIATRLRSLLRESDTAARPGGDEFTFILENIGSRTTGSLNGDADRAQQDLAQAEQANDNGEEAELYDRQKAARINAAHTAAKILAAIAEPYEVAGELISVSASLGISLFPDHGAQPAELLHAADAAMYTAKEIGKNAYRFYDAEEVVSQYGVIS